MRTYKEYADSYETGFDRCRCDALLECDDEMVTMNEYIENTMHEIFGKC